MFGGDVSSASPRPPARIRITIKSADILDSMLNGDATEAEIIESALMARYGAGIFTLASVNRRLLSSWNPGCLPSHQAETARWMLFR